MPRRHHDFVVHFGAGTARRFETHLQEKVTDATFTFVAIDEAGKPRVIPKEGA